MRGGYQTDLAYIHDVGFSGFVRGAAPWLLRTLRSHGIRRGLVVDLGCGSGRWAADLLRAGYEVEGVDLSPAMVALARQNAPEAKFRVGSLLRARIPKCSAVTALGECVNYAFDSSNREESLQALFRRVHDALPPGGLFIFDAAEPGMAAGRPARSWYEGKDWAILLELAEPARGRTCVRSMTVFRRVGSVYRRSEEVHPMRLYGRAELRRMLEQTKFQVEIVEGYGKPFRQRALAGYVAKKVG